MLPKSMAVSGLTYKISVSVSVNGTWHYVETFRAPFNYLKLISMDAGIITVTVTVTANLFKCPKNKRPRELPLDIRLSRLHFMHIYPGKTMTITVIRALG
jgi:hypothetical protein